MRIEFLQAGTGDSIWISHNKKNIVIDGGKTTSAIIARYDQMAKDENIDLLVVTHIDTDHIAGIIALMDHIKIHGQTGRLKQVWFNYPKKEDDGEYSVNEGNQLSGMLCKIEGLNWCNNTSELIGKVTAIGDLRLHVLAPDHDVADEYKPKEADELGARNADWNVDLEALIDHMNDDDIDEGGPNSQSIVILLECNDKRALLPGDCTPKELYEALRAYKRRNEQPLSLELMKLPHHGSLRNITKEIMEEVVCSEFVISTNVNKRYCFPHKETIAKLVYYRNKSEEQVNVHFNYQESVEVLGVTDAERRKYNINLDNCREFNL